MFKQSLWKVVAAFPALRAAAANSRMPYDRLTKMEAEYFPQLLKNRWSTSMYLYCRNKIVITHANFVQIVHNFDF